MNASRYRWSTLCAVSVTFGVGVMSHNSEDVCDAVSVVVSAPLNSF